MWCGLIGGGGWGLFYFIYVFLGVCVCGGGGERSSCQRRSPVARVRSGCFQPKYHGTTAQQQAGRGRLHEE